jgi:hypothetical protein
VFLWIPKDQAPGVGAVCLFLLRQITLPLVLMIGPFVLWEAVAPAKFDPLRHMSSMPGWATAIIVPLIFGCIIFVQELGRYSFVRKAERPLRALAVFTAVVIVCILVLNHDRLYTMVWMICAQLAASGVLFYGLHYRRYIYAIILAIVIGHTAIFVTAPQFFRPAEPASSAASQSDSTAPVAPSAGGMQSWARLYPGAAITRSSVDTLFGITDWKVTYKVHASADQIEAFYKTTASEQGFADEGSLLGMHRFTQDSTRNDFSITIAPDPVGSLVIFDARASGESASPGGKH